MRSYHRDALMTLTATNLLVIQYLLLALQRYTGTSTLFLLRYTQRIEAVAAVRLNPAEDDLDVVCAFLPAVLLSRGCSKPGNLHESHSTRRLPRPRCNLCERDLRHRNHWRRLLTATSGLPKYMRCPVGALLFTSQPETGRGDCRLGLPLLRPQQGRSATLDNPLLVTPRGGARMLGCSSTRTTSTTLTPVKAT